MYKNIIIALLLCLNISHVKADNNDYSFLIYGDSNNIQETYEVKNKLLGEFKELVRGLDESDYGMAICDGLVVDHVQYENNTVIVVLGDGNGRILKGKLKANYCKIEKEEVETTFFFKKLWQKATS